MVGTRARRSSQQQASRAARGRLLAAGLAPGLLALLAPGRALGGGAPVAGIRPAAAGGDTGAAIRGTVDAFRSALGPDNGTGGTFQSGRREINWDNVPDAQSAPNNLPPNYYNSSSPRGVAFSTRGTGLSVSAAPTANVPVRFGNLHPTYTAFFRTFSGARLFTALGSTRFDVTLFLPGTTTPAMVSGSGSVFSNVSDPNTSGIEFFDSRGNLLGEAFAPPGALSVAGGQLDGTGARIARVRVKAGNTPLGVQNKPTAIDLVAVDDLIYAEPQGGAPATPSAVPSATPVPRPITRRLCRRSRWCWCHQSRRR